MRVSVPQIAFHGVEKQLGKTARHKRQRKIKKRAAQGIAINGNHSGANSFQESEGSGATENAPMLSVHFHPSRDVPVMATAGADNTVKLWKRTEEEGKAECLKFLVSLMGHQKTVNCARFSPCGRYLATASDDGNLMLWSKNLNYEKFKKTAEDAKENAIAIAPSGGLVSSSPVDKKEAVAEAPTQEASSAALPSPQEEDAEFWLDVREERALTRRFLGRHTCDVYDLTWSADSRMVASGGIDSTLTIWDVSTGRAIENFRDHTHYIQGVAFDPYMQYVLSQSSDRTCHVYAKEEIVHHDKKARKRKRTAEESFPKYRLDAVLQRRSVLVEAAPSASSANEKNAPSPAAKPKGFMDNFVRRAEKRRKTEQKIFFDDAVPTFFRRPAFSPDGSMLVVPTGHIKEKGSKAKPATYVYVRGKWHTPAVSLTGAKKPSIAARFCPLAFELVQDPNPNSPTSSPWAKGLDYRMVFAVATLDAVLIYDTQHTRPIAIMENVHFAQLTDLAWAADGRTLVCSSADGYCTLCMFDEGELGVEMPREKLPAVFSRTLPAELLPEQESVDGNSPEKSFDVPAPANKSTKSKTVRRVATTLLSATSAATATSAAAAPPPPPPPPAPCSLGEDEAKAKPARRRVATTLLSAS